MRCSLTLGEAIQFGGHLQSSVVRKIELFKIVLIILFVGRIEGFNGYFVRKEVVSRNDVE